MVLVRLSLLVLLGLAFLEALRAEDPLASRTLIVYATNSPDSIAVKDYYINARFTNPATAKVCPVTPADPNATGMLESDYINQFRTPIRNCLNAVGRTNILYIVLAYIRTFEVGVIGGVAYGYALDSYLADIWDQYTTIGFNPTPPATHRYYADAQAEGNYFPPFVSLANYRTQPRSQLIYSVWRLDGATKEIAMGLVDKATAAMNNATGSACIDRRFGPIQFQSDLSYGQGEFDLYQAANFLRNAGVNVIEDQEGPEFGEAGGPAKCPSDGSAVSFYSGWYNLNHYNGAGVFNWAPGAIGFHLDSASGIDPRSGPNWVANALLNGITVTSGVMNEPYLEGIPRPGGFFRNLLEGANVGDAMLRNTRWIKWMTYYVGDPLYRPFAAGGRAPYNAPVAENSFTIANRFPLGGTSTTGTVTLATAAPAGGATVALLSIAPSVVTVPATVTVPENSRSVTFTINTTVVPDYQTVEIHAAAGAVQLRNSVLVLRTLSQIALSANPVQGGATVIGTLVLNAAAPAGGLTVALSSNDPAVTVPASVTVSAGLARATFPITTTPVSSTKTAQISATYGGSAVQANLTVNP